MHRPYRATVEVEVSLFFFGILYVTIVPSSGLDSRRPRREQGSESQLCF